MAFANINDIMAMAKARQQVKTIAVAAAADEHTLEAVMMARNNGFIKPVLVGDKAKIKSILNDIGESIVEENIIDANDPIEAARIAVRLARDGKADLLMKGKLNTSDIMRAVLNKEEGLPHGGLLTCMSLTELPGYHKILVVNDGAITPYPTLDQKVAQVRMVTQAMHNMGYGDDIKVGVLCANEVVNPKIPESVDAADIKRMNLEGEITGCIVEGPISLDIALKAEVAKAKGFNSPVAGDVDYLLFPNLVTGNVYSKAIEMAGATPVTMVLGATVPIVLTSRATSKKVKYYSLVVASTVADKEKDNV